MPINAAAWLKTKYARLEVDSAPYTSARENEIVVKNYAVAVNPVDWIKQSVGDFIFSWIPYPFIFGSDLAGEVVEVGKNVTRFKIGDRVLGHAVGMDPQRNSAAESAFQAYTVLLAHMAAPIPDGLSYESAAVLPLGLSTAACGLFQKDHLALEYPSVSPKPNGKTLIIWGGSTSVGSNAIQLGVAAGYEVITTCSPRNFHYVKNLGASQVFDYRDKNAVNNVINACKGKTLAGALSIGAGSAKACLDIVHACEGRKFVSMATFPVSFAQESKRPGIGLRIFEIAGQFLWFNAATWVKSRTRGLQTKFIFGSSLISNEVGKMIYEVYLPQALADGKFIAAPDAQIIGTGLEYVQAGLDRQRKGVSAAKIVISLR